MEEINVASELDLLIITLVLPILVLATGGLRGDFERFPISIDPNGLCLENLSF